MCRDTGEGTQEEYGNHQGNQEYYINRQIYIEKRKRRRRGGRRTLSCHLKYAKSLPYQNVNSGKINKSLLHTLIGGGSLTWQQDITRFLRCPAFQTAGKGNSIKEDTQKALSLTAGHKKTLGSTRLDDRKDFTSIPKPFKPFNRFPGNVEL